MTFDLNDETLVAYVDGQLDARETAEVEAALTGNAEARETVRDLRQGAALLRGAFNEPLDQPVPERVLEAIDRSLAAQAVEPDDLAGRRRWSPRPWQMALAASFAAVMIGLGAGFVLSDYRVDQRLAALEAAVAADREARREALSAALEKLASGESVAWENPDSGRRGNITPVRTFKTVQGEWCREYADDEWLGDRREVRRAIACRVGEGQWKTRLVLYSDT